MLAGDVWDAVFGQVASVNSKSIGKGPDLSLRITKKPQVALMRLKMDGSGVMH